MCSRCQHLFCNLFMQTFYFLCYEHYTMMPFDWHLICLSFYFSDDLVGLGSETLVQTTVSGQCCVHFNLHNFLYVHASARPFGLSGLCGLLFSSWYFWLSKIHILQTLAYNDLGIVVMPHFILLRHSLSCLSYSCNLWKKYCSHWPKVICSCWRGSGQLDNLLTWNLPLKKQGLCLDMYSLCWTNRS